MSRDNLGSAGSISNKLLAQMLCRRPRTLDRLVLILFLVDFFECGTTLVTQASLLSVINCKVCRLLLGGILTK